VAALCPPMGISEVQASRFTLTRTEASTERRLFFCGLSLLIDLDFPTCFFAELTTQLLPLASVSAAFALAPGTWPPSILPSQHGLLWMCFCTISFFLKLNLFDLQVVH
jgi:hypothetical protein